MRTIEIARQDWSEFVAEINRTAARRPVRLEVENMELGDQELGRLLPLQGLDLDHDSFEIIVGLSDVLTHEIERPTRFFARYDEDDDIECLCIEDADDGKTLIYFERLPKLPDEWGFIPPEEEAPAAAE